MELEAVGRGDRRIDLGTTITVGMPVLEQRLQSPAGKWSQGTVPEVGPLPRFPRPNVAMFLTFLAFVVFRYVDGSHRLDIFATVRFEFMLGGVAVLMAIFKIMAEPIQLGSSTKIVLFIALLFVTMVFQLPLAWDPPEAQRVFTDRVFKFALLAFLIAAMVESPTTLKLFIGAFLFSMYYITLETTEGLISGSLVWENQGIMRLHGASPMYGHPNSLAGAAMGSLPFVIFLLWPYRNWFIRLGLLATASTSLICIIFSGSRTGYLGLLSLTLWWFFQSRRKATFLIIGVVVGIAVVSVLPEQYIERFKSIGGKEAEGNSKGTRIVILQDAMAILQENPLGVGVASFPAIRAARFGRHQDTHNLYLEVATNLGVQGFIVFMGLVAVILINLRSTAHAFRAQRARLKRLLRQKGLSRSALRRIEQHDRDLVFCDGTAQAVAGFIIVRLILGLFGMDLYEIYWWFAAGLAISLAGLVISTDRRTRYFEEYALVNANSDS